jgi:hypothetical protein
MKRRPWTAVELELLLRNYADSRTDDLATALGRPVSQIYQAAQRFGLQKSPEYLASEDACRLRRGGNVGEASRFKPGQPPWNRGLKGVVGVQEACRATQFKPGRPAHEAANYLPIGSLRITRGGYLERKVTDDPALAPARRWVAEHRLVWEAVNGPIPPGCVVVFKHGRNTVDRAAVTVDALELVTRRELMRRNSFRTTLPPELVHLVQLRGPLSRQINKRAKEAT